MIFGRRVRKGIAMDMSKTFEALDKQSAMEKLGVPRDVFLDVAAKYAFERIKDIQNPAEAAVEFVKIVKEFDNAVK